MYYDASPVALSAASKLRQLAMMAKITELRYTGNDVAIRVFTLQILQEGAKWMILKGHQ
jgi:hypothetical protein